MMLVLSVIALLLAVIPVGLFVRNLPLFTAWNDSQPKLHRTPSLSVLIPARDEEDSIEASVRAALASEDVEVEVVVLDDHSTDRTAAIVKEIAQSDPRVRYQTSRSLPPDWNGKQFACRQLADAASHPLLVFIDADVRLRPNALAKLVAYKEANDPIHLLSAFPHQETGTWMEKWIIPLMHFILLGFLPLNRMRQSRLPAYAAGCGQLFMTEQDDYWAAGTHEAIAESRHDGLKLPRVYREQGLMTDVVDGSQIAECRMYHHAGEVIRGVLKNAIEGIANPRLILPFSVMLLGGAVLPVVTLVLSLAGGDPVAASVAAVALLAGHLPRAIAAAKLRQPLAGVLFHSAATLIFVALQWVALLNHLTGRQIAWRGRKES